MTGQRQYILEGMLQAVGTQGYERATVADAVEAAGTDIEAFYELFRDKQDCYLQAIDAGSAWLELAMRDEATGAATWREQLRGALRGLLTFLDEHPGVGRALLVEVHAAGPAAAQKRTEAMQRAAAAVDSARAESDGRAPAISAEAVVAGVLAVLHGRLSANKTDDFLELLPELTYLAVLPYFGAEAASDEMELSRE